MNMEQTVEATDIDTDSATFPLTQYVSRFEVEPPGAMPHRMTPIACSTGSEKIFDAAKAMSGMKPNWEDQPMMKARFFVRYMSRKYAGYNVAPRPNEIAKYSTRIRMVVASRPVSSSHVTLAKSVSPPGSGHASLISSCTDKSHDTFPRHAASMASATRVRLQKEEAFVEKSVSQLGTYAARSIPTAATERMLSVFSERPSHDSDRVSSADAAHN